MDGVLPSFIYSSFTSRIIYILRYKEAQSASYIKPTWRTVRRAWKIRTLSVEDTVLSCSTSASCFCHKNGIFGSRFKVQGSSVFFCHFEQSEKSEYVHRRGNPLWLPDSSLRCVACVGTHKGIPECNVRHISGQTHRSAPTVRRDLTNIVWGRNEYSMETNAV